MMVKIEQSISMRRNSAVSVQQPILFQVVRVVRHVKTAQRDTFVSRIIQLHPTAIVERRVKIHIHIGSHDFVNDEILTRRLISLDCHPAISFLVAAILRSGNDITNANADSRDLPFTVYCCHTFLGR